MEYICMGTLMFELVNACDSECITCWKEPSNEVNEDDWMLWLAFSPILILLCYGDCTHGVQTLKLKRFNCGTT